MVDIVIGFLSSGGVKPEKPLGEYVDKRLKMKRRLSQKVLSCVVYKMKKDDFTFPSFVNFVTFNIFYHCGKLCPWNWQSLPCCKTRYTQYKHIMKSLQGILLCQDPFDTFDKKCLCELEEDQVAALDGCLRSFDLDRLLGALYEFMETYVKYCPDNHLTWT